MYASRPRPCTNWSTRNARLCSQNLLVLKYILTYRDCPLSQVLGGENVMLPLQMITLATPSSPPWRPKTRHSTHTSHLHPGNQCNTVPRSKDSDQITEANIQDRHLWCHRRYCSALENHFIALDVCFIVMYLHSYRALHCGVVLGWYMNRTCIVCLRVQLE